MPVTGCKIGGKYEECKECTFKKYGTKECIAYRKEEEENGEIVELRRERMTNNYDDEAPYEIKMLEETRMIRCCLERILQAKYPQYFVDYQMEKFGRKVK